MLKRRYDQEGINLRQAQLLKSFWHQLIKFYQPLANLQLIKNIALFSHLLMMREIEIVYWAALNTEEDIQILINQCIKDKG